MGGIEGLSQEEEAVCHSDSALLLKHLGLWLRAQECRIPTMNHDVGMLLESPRDPQGMKLPGRLPFGTLRRFNS